MSGIHGILLGRSGGFPSGAALIDLLYADEPAGSPSIADFTLIGNGNLATSPGSVAGNNWYVWPNIVGIGAGYWARLDVVSGAAPTTRPGADGTLINIGSGAGIRWALRRDADGTSTAEWRLRIYSDAAGSTLVSDTTFDVTAIVIPAGITFPTGSAFVTRIRTTNTSEVWIGLQPDGTITSVGNDCVHSTNWRFPTLAAVGNGFWAQCDDIDGIGTIFSPTGVPLQLNIGRNWGYSTGFVSTNITSPFRLRISTNSAMTAVVCDATFDIISQRP